MALQIKQDSRRGLQTASLLGWQEDVPVNIGGNGAGPRFHVPDMPQRDAVGRAMSQTAAASLKRRGSQRTTTPLAAVGSARQGTGTPGAGLAPVRVMRGSAM